MNAAFALIRAIEERSWEKEPKEKDEKEEKEEKEEEVRYEKS